MKLQVPSLSFPKKKHWALPGSGGAVLMEKGSPLFLFIFTHNVKLECDIAILCMKNGWPDMQNTEPNFVISVARTAHWTANPRMEPLSLMSWPEERQLGLGPWRSTGSTEERELGLCVRWSRSCCWCYIANICIAPYCQEHGLLDMQDDHDSATSVACTLHGITDNGKLSMKTLKGYHDW